MTLHQTNDRPLRKVLLANALFSTISGLTLILAPEASAGLLFAEAFVLFGIASEPLLFALGLGLLIFAGFVAFTARQKRLRLGQAKMIVLADLLWVVDSAVLLTVFADRLAPYGFELVLIVAAIVLALAVEQVIGLALIYQGKSQVEITRAGSHMTVTAMIGTTAPAARVWQVMSDQAGYAAVADNLSRSEIVEGEGLDMVRRCTDTKGKSWRETCTLWDAGRAFAFRVHTEAADYPYPIAELTGEWSLAPAPTGSEIRMVFEVEAKPGMLNRLLLTAMSATFAKVCDRLLRRWVRIMEKEDEPVAALAGSGDGRVSVVTGG